MSNLIEPNLTTVLQVERDVNDNSHQRWTCTSPRPNDQRRLLQICLTSKNKKARTVVRNATASRLPLLEAPRFSTTRSPGYYPSFPLSHTAQRLLYFSFTSSRALCPRTTPRVCVSGPSFPPVLDKLAHIQPQCSPSQSWVTRLSLDSSAALRACASPRLRPEPA